MRPTRWRITSNTRKTLALAAGSLLLGLLLVWLAGGARVGGSNATAAMWLGILLAALGVAAFVFAENLVVTVDTSERRLVIDRFTRWGNSRTLLPFVDVESIRVAKLGSGADGTPSYWLQVHCRRGEVYRTGRWSTDEAEINELAEQVADAVGCASRKGTPARPGTSVPLVTAAAALGAAALYALWYRLAVGPWCPAMWFGTAPPVIILLAFSVLLGFLRRIWR
jgi:hypothetical protein